MSSHMTELSKSIKEFLALQRLVGESGLDAEVRSQYGAARAFYMVIVGPEPFTYAYLVQRDKHWLLTDAVMEAGDDADFLARLRRLAYPLDARDIDLLMTDFPIRREHRGKRPLALMDGQGRHLLFEKNYIPPAMMDG
jgi:hypothetical protein